ncbi:hypothetical protein BGP_6104 [Beggiatoa sp. PS]|nr:hypothetical protein BGP_6104 [Beggiatoa sp. PS]
MQLSQAANQHDDENNGLVTAVQRVENEGYEYQWIEESTAIDTSLFSMRPPFIERPSLSETSLKLYEGLFRNPEERMNILSSNFKEVGIGFSSNSKHLTINVSIDTILTTFFATSLNDPRAFVLGVVYRDKDENGFYSIGEGIADVQITLVETGEKL